MAIADTATEHLLAVLPLINRIVSQAVRQEAGDETTMPQFRALALLEHTQLTLSALARSRRVSLQAMGELIQVLVERGWIVRTPDLRDRRQAQLSLTEAGRQHFQRAETASLQHLAPLLAQLSADELRAVEIALPALQRVLTPAEGE